MDAITIAFYIGEGELEDADEFLVSVIQSVIKYTVSN